MLQVCQAVPVLVTNAHRHVGLIAEVLVSVATDELLLVPVDGVLVELLALVRGVLCFELVFIFSRLRSASLRSS